jgi:hypothetical protein
MIAAAIAAAIASLVVWADWELRNPLELRDDDPEGWL